MNTEHNRRRLLVGGAAIGIAGAAFAAEPRRMVVDFTRTPLAELVPLKAGPWEGAEDPNVVPDRIDNSIDRGQTISRIYAGVGLQPVMLVASYHGPASPELKVHRPETCYTVAGFACETPRPAAIALGRSTSVPSVLFTARREARVETVLYWTRVGRRFPQSLTRQRMDFLVQALHGVRADGLLLRISAIGDDPQQSRKLLEAFAASMVADASAAGRQLLLGPSRSAPG